MVNLNLIFILAFGLATLECVKMASFYQYNPNWYRYLARNRHVPPNHSYLYSVRSYIPPPRTASTTETTTSTTLATTTTEPPTTAQTTTAATSTIEDTTAPFIVDIPNNITDIEKECSKLSTKFLRSTCSRIMKNPLIKNMNGIRAAIGAEEERTLPLQIERAFRLTSRSNTQLYCPENDDKCPDYTIENKSRGKSIMSLSPWNICRQYDPNRFPQWLNVAKCRCKGCINPETGVETSNNVLSQEIRIDLNVLRKDVLSFDQCTRKSCREVWERISVGCHCALAQIQ